MTTTLVEATGLRKAAVLLLKMGVEGSAKILSRMREAVTDCRLLHGVASLCRDSCMVALTTCRLLIGVVSKASSARGVTAISLPPKWMPCGSRIQDAMAKPGSGPRTGDESNIALWAGMGLISIAAAAGVVLLIKKRGKGK